LALQIQINEMPWPDLQMFSWERVVVGIILFLITFSVSLGVVSLIMIRIPADYFRKDSPRKVLPNHHRAVRGAVLVARNILGAFLVVLGIVMSLPGVPGQGVLTILLGVMLLDFPGKRTLEHKLVSKPRVHAAINKLRNRFGKPDLILD
jgi:hypothetical protein